MKRIIGLLLVLISIGAAAQPGKLILDRGLLPGPTLRDNWLFAGKALKIPVYPDTATANQWLANDSAGLVIQIASGQIFHRIDSAGAKKWSYYWGVNGGGAGGAAVWGGITGTLSSQTDLQNALNGKQNLLPVGTVAQYIDGTLNLRTFPTNLSAFTNGPGYLTSVRDSNSITGTGVLGSPVKLVNDITSPGARYYYGTDTITGVKGWFRLPAVFGGGSGSVSIATAFPVKGGVITSAGTIGLDTTSSNPSAAVTQYQLSQTSGGLVAPNTAKRYLNGYKSFVLLNTDSITEGATNLFFTNARARLAISALQPIRYNNATGVITGDTTYTTGSALTTHFQLIKGLDSIRQIRDTVAFTKNSPGTPIIFGKGTDTVYGRGIQDLYGMHHDTLGTSGSIRSYHDTAQYYIPPGIVPGNKNVDNGPIINAAWLAMKNTGRKVLINFADTVWTKTSILPQSGSGLAGLGYNKTILKGNFTSDHRLMDNPTASVDHWYVENIGFDGTGPNTSHRVMLANSHWFDFTNVGFFDNDTTGAGIAFGVGAFAPYATYKSDHFTFKNLYFFRSYNAGLQLGNVDYVDGGGMFGAYNYREFLGVEPFNINGEGGRVNHVHIQNIQNVIPASTADGGSETGNVIITESSAAGEDSAMSDIHLKNIVFRGSNKPSQHAVACFGCHDTYVDGVNSDSSGGFGINVTSNTIGGVIYNAGGFHATNVRIRSAGLDGSSSAGVSVKDGKLNYFSNMDLRGNPKAFQEIGFAQSNYWDNINVFGVPFDKNNGSHSYPSRYVNIYSDSSVNWNINSDALNDTYLPTDSIAFWHRATNGQMQLGKTSLVNLLGADTSNPSLESVMTNSSYLKTNHVVSHIAKTLEFNGGIFNPTQFRQGVRLENVGGLLANNYGAGTLTYVDSTSGSTHIADHLWFVGRGNVKTDLLAASGGVTPNLDAVLAQGGSLAANRTIDASTNNLFFTGSNAVRFTGGVDVNGLQIQLPGVNPVTGSYTASTNETYLPVDLTSGNATVTLTCPSTGGSAIYFIKRTDATASRTLTVQMSSGNIDGASTYTSTAARTGLVVMANNGGGGYIIAVK